MAENTNNPWLTGGNKYALNAQKIAKAKKDGTYVNDTTKGVDPKHTNNDAPKAATLLQDTGTQLLHGVQTLGGSVIGDAVNAVSPSAAKWLDKNTWGMIPHTTQEQFEANRPSTQRDRWNNSVANEKPSSSTWENRTTDSANAVTSAVAGEVIGGAMGWLGKKIKPKDTRFLINQLGFNAPAAKSATVSMPFKDKLAMAELDAKRKLSRGWRDVKEVANKATLPIRDYKDYRTARKLQRDLRYDAWNFTSDGSPKYNLEQLRNHVFEKVKLKYSDKASNFDSALSSLELKGLWAGKNSNAAKRANFWKAKVTPKEVPRDTDWLNIPITEGNFKKFAKTGEFKNMEPYMYFTEFTDSPNNKFVGDKWGLKTFREFDYLLNKNRVKPPQSLRTEYGSWADNLNSALAEKSKRDIKVGGSSLSFVKGHTNKLPGDIDRYVWDKNAGQKFVEWKSGDGPLYKFGNINFSGTQGQPGIAQVHKAYQNPVELHSINMSNVNKALRGAKPSTDFKVDPTNLDMSNATLTDLFLSSKPKHVDRFYQVASNSSYDELSKAFNTKLSGMSSKKVDFPEFVTSNVKDNLEFLRRVAPELGGKELSNLAADQNKMKIILNNFYLDTSTGTRYTRNYKHGVSKNVTDPTNLKKILHSSDGSGGQAYSTPGLLDVYYGKGNTNAGYGDISMTTKASLNLPNKPTPKDLLDNMTNYKDGVRLVSQDIMTFPHSTSVGYGVGEPLSVSAGSTNSFAPRIINPENSIRLRELDNAIRGQLSVKKADLSPKHAKKLKSSLNTKYPYGIPEDKQHLYNLLESYSDKVKYDKLNYSWFSSMGEKYPRWRHKIQNVDIGDVSIPQLNERAWRKNLNKAGTAYSNAKAVVGGSSLVGGVYAGGKALTDHTERKFQKEYAKMRQDKEASDKKWLDLRLDAGISEEDARIERRGEFNRNDSLRSDSRRQRDNWENEGLSKSKIRAKYKELEGKNREESIKRRTARDNELKAMIQERARKLREISSKKSGGVLKAQKGTNSRFFGPVDPKVHEDTRNYIAENVSDSTQQQRWQDLNRMSGYPRFTKTDSTFTGTPHYNPITNATVGLPLQEQAHAYQHNAEGSLVKGTVTDWLKFPYFTKAGQSKLYGKKGTQEYDAHTVIPQVFNRFINGGIKESQVKPYIEMRRNAKQGEEDFSTPYTKKDDYKTVYRLQEGLGKRQLLHDSVKVYPGVFSGVLDKETIQALENFNTKK